MGRCLYYVGVSFFLLFNDAGNTADEGLCGDSTHPLWNYFVLGCRLVCSEDAKRSSRTLLCGLGEAGFASQSRTHARKGREWDDIARADENIGCLRMAICAGGSVSHVHGCGLDHYYAGRARKRLNGGESVTVKYSARRSFDDESGVPALANVVA